MVHKIIQAVAFYGTHTLPANEWLNPVRRSRRAADLRDRRFYPDVIRVCVMVATPVRAVEWVPLGQEIVGGKQA